MYRKLIASSLPILVAACASSAKTYSHGKCAG
jgi:hypothetical protein